MCEKLTGEMRGHFACRQSVRQLPLVLPRDAVLHMVSNFVYSPMVVVLLGDKAIDLMRSRSFTPKIVHYTSQMKDMYTETGRTAGL